MSAEDRFELELEDKTSALQYCQAKRNPKLTCVGCKEFFKCKTRLEYVSSVYNSMSKGKSGGFEF